MMSKSSLPHCNWVIGNPSFASPAARVLLTPTGRIPRNTIARMTQLSNAFSAGSYSQYQWRTRSARQLAGHAAGLLSPSSKDPYTACVSFLRANAFLEAYDGKAWAVEKEETETNPYSADPRTLGAETFLRYVRSGQMDAKGPLRNEGNMASSAFLDGARVAFRDCKKGMPRFITVTAAHWGKLAQGDGTALDHSPNYEVSLKMGKNVARILKTSFKLAMAAGLRPLLVNNLLHIRDITEYIRAGGWLIGRTERIKSGALKIPNGEEKACAEESAYYLERNVHSIVSCALFHGELWHIGEKANGLEEDVKKLREKIELLRSTSEKEAADVLERIKGSIIGRNLNQIRQSRGRIEMIAKALEGNDGFIKYLRGVIEMLRGANEDAVADAIEKHIDAIISRTVLYGRRWYFGAVVDVLEGKNSFIQILDREIKKLRKSGQVEIASALEENKGTIISYTLRHRRLEYVDKVVRSFEGDDGFIIMLRRQIERLRAMGKEDTVLALEKNIDFIISCALDHGILNAPDAIKFYFAHSASRKKKGSKKKGL